MQIHICSLVREWRWWREREEEGRKVLHNHHIHVDLHIIIPDGEAR